MFKKFLIVLISFILITSPSLSEKTDENIKVEMYEVCADDLFVRQFGDKFRYYLSMHVKSKIYQIINQVIEFQ